jgi:hypothetical protein
VWFAARVLRVRAQLCRVQGVVERKSSEFASGRTREGDGRRRRRGGHGVAGSRFVWWCCVLFSVFRVRAAVMTKDMLGVQQYHHRQQRERKRRRRWRRRRKTYANTSRRTSAGLVRTLTALDGLFARPAGETDGDDFSDAAQQAQVRYERGGSRRVWCVAWRGVARRGMAATTTGGGG